MFFFSAAELKADQQAHVRLLSELQQHPTFDLRAFESCIDKIRDAVAEVLLFCNSACVYVCAHDHCMLCVCAFISQHLWKLLVEELDLVGHLQVHVHVYCININKEPKFFTHLLYMYMYYCIL